MVNPAEVIPCQQPVEEVASNPLGKWCAAINGPCTEDCPAGALQAFLDGQAFTEQGFGPFRDEELDPVEV